MLKTRAAYMLNKNGELIEVLPLHPYLIYNAYDSIKEELTHLIYDRPEHINFFYHHIDDEMFKSDLNALIKSSAEIYGTPTNFDFYDGTVTNFVINEQELFQLYNYLNKYTNQEFIRVRISDKHWCGESSDIYFRIGSEKFNWFNIIYKIVYDNSNFINSITICGDEQARPNGTMIYRNKGLIYDHASVEAFILQKGNPTVEEYGSSYASKLRQGLNFNEAFGSIYIGHIVHIIDSYAQDRMENTDIFW